MSLLVFTAVLNAQADPKARSAKSRLEIAITFDELPAAQSFDEVDVRAINYLILETLKQYDVKAVGFVVGLNIGDNYDILGDWLNAGHKLGTMTFTNQDINELDPDKFIQEIVQGENALDEMLDNFGQKTHYFRYPFLHYGESAEVKKQVRTFLASRGFVVAHATVVPEDYLYDLSLQKMGKTPDSVEYLRLLDEYVNSVIDELERVEQLAQNRLGRPVKQILRLRANRLNAMFLGDILGAIRDKGYKFITLDAALRDPVYSQTENYTGTRGIGWLDMVLRSKR
jgi:peptidoglycan/xylan/chitin deacetylase (PgdA/CDA1 family)